jgi:uncharacterized protein YpmB
MKKYITGIGIILIVIVLLVIFLILNSKKDYYTGGKTIISKWPLNYNNGYTNLLLFDLSGNYKKVDINAIFTYVDSLIDTIASEIMLDISDGFITGEYIRLTNKSKPTITSDLETAYSLIRLKYLTKLKEKTGSTLTIDEVRNQNITPAQLKTLSDEVARNSKLVNLGANKTYNIWTDAKTQKNEVGTFVGVNSFGYNGFTDSNVVRSPNLSFLKY